MQLKTMLLSELTPLMTTESGQLSSTEKTEDESTLKLTARLRTFTTL